MAAPKHPHEIFDRKYNKIEMKYNHFVSIKTNTN